MGNLQRRTSKIGHLKTQNRDTYSDRKVVALALAWETEKMALFNSSALIPLEMRMKINPRSHWERLRFEMAVTVILN